MAIASTGGAHERTSRGLVGAALLYLLTVAAPAEAAPLKWRWSNPKPHGGNIVDMAYSPLLGLIIQVAERGQIFASYDSKLWVPRASGTTNDLRAVTFFGGRVIVTGEAGRVLYSDGGDEFFPGLLNSPTTDWFEAVTASPNLAVTVGDRGMIYTTTDGIHWQRQSSGTTEWLRGVTFGNGGFVAVGEGGTILSSPTGANWTPRASGITVPFNRIGYNLGRYTAVAENGLCRYSTNGGVTWYGEVTGAVGDLFHTTKNDQARLAVGDFEVRLQDTDGLWTDELARSDGPFPWTYFGNIARQNYFLIAGRTGLMEEAFRTNGVFTWMPLEGSPRSWLWDIAIAADLYVAVGDRATVMTSVNGGRWKLEVVPPAATNAVFLGVGGNDNLLVAAGNQGSLIISPNVITNVTVAVTNQDGTIVRTNIPGSAFGVLWYAVPVPSTNDLQGVFVSSNLCVVTGGGGTILTSATGTNWTTRSSHTTLALSSVTQGPNGWVTTGDDGAIVTSPDAMTWSRLPPPTPSWIYRVRHLGGLFVAVGQNGIILTSTNGTDWVKRTSGTTKWLNDIAWVDQAWYVVGNSGTVLKSTNLVSWADLGTITRKNLYGAATDGIQLIAVGLEGSILRSQVAPDLTPKRILSYDRVAITNGTGSAYWQSIYLFGGRPDQRFTLDYRLDFETNKWAPGPLLDLFDGSGTLFYLETFTGTNPPPREFYRTTLAP